VQLECFAAIHACEAVTLEVRFCEVPCSPDLTDVPTTNRSKDSLGHVHAGALSLTVVVPHHVSLMCVAIVGVFFCVGNALHDVRHIRHAERIHTRASRVLKRDFLVQ